MTYLVSGIVAHAIGMLVYQIAGLSFPTVFHDVVPIEARWIDGILPILAVFSLAFGLVHVPLMLLLFKIKPDSNFIVREAILSGGIVGTVTYPFTLYALSFFQIEARWFSAGRLLLFICIVGAAMLNGYILGKTYYDVCDSTEWLTFDEE